MNKLQPLLERLARRAQNLRIRVSHAEALPQLAALGIVSGAVAGAVIILFRLAVESIQESFLAGNAENYEALSLSARFFLPLAGAVILGLIFHFLPAAAREVGVVHVLERLAYHQARLPGANVVAQFFGAAVSIISGHSVGREGPAIHMGAASGSLAGQWLKLPNNSLRILAGCGTAAAIAASFNTPLAGVIFAMEVVLMEYTVIGFAPVILAAVTGTALSRLVFGPQPAFIVPPLNLGSLLELPYILAMGIAIGAAAALFIRLLIALTRRTRTLPVWLRMSLGGLAVALLALPAPQIMGIGYDTVNASLVGEIGLWLLLVIVVCKFLATAAAVGCGLPGGFIGPLFVIGAVLGAALGVIGQWLAPAHASSSGLYALLGMAAMMAGALHAPLAALTAALELTSNPHVILPGMLAVIAAYITCRQYFAREPAFVALMRARGLDYRLDPMAQALRRVGVGGAMDPSIAVLPRRIARAQLNTALAARPRWLLVAVEGDPIVAMPAAELVRHANEHEGESEFDLLQLPAKRAEITAIDLTATLQQALEELNRGKAEALYVRDASGLDAARVHGLLTRENIERYYRI